MSLLRWVGGKAALAEQIISCFPDHSRYIEPFFGAGSVFFQKIPVKENYINDINSDLVNLYEVVRDNPDELLKLLRLTPKSEEEFDRFKDLYYERKDDYSKLSSVRKALIYYYIIRCSFNGMGKSYSVGYFLNDGILELIQTISKRLKNTDILCRDWTETLKFANRNTVIYLDPPYMLTTEAGNKYYEHCMSYEEHVKLRNELLIIMKKCYWVLSYDVHPKVDELYGGIEGIYMNKTPELFQASNNKHASNQTENTSAGSFKSEYIITNFPIQESLPLFSTVSSGNPEIDNLLNGDNDLTKIGGKTF